MQPYHVRVIPVTRASGWLQHVLVCEEPVHNGKHTLPGVLDVVIVTPQVADLCQDGVVHLMRRTGSGRRGKRTGRRGGGAGALLNCGELHCPESMCKAEESGEGQGGKGKEARQSHIPLCLAKQPQGPWGNMISYQLQE